MILEVGLIDVLPGSEPDFEAGYQGAKHALAGSEGCLSVRMTRGVETPSRFVLMVEWRSLADHEAFRAGAGFGIWRAGIGPHFDGPPRVEHFADID